MRAEDLAQVEVLSEQLGHPIAAGARANLRRLAGDPNHCLLVAAEGERILGWVHALGGRFLFYRPFVEVGGRARDRALRTRPRATTGRRRHR
jgi:hypothetical protein